MDQNSPIPQPEQGPQPQRDQTPGGPPGPAIATALPLLTIQLNTNGTVTVNGPITDKVLSYGMLELAKDAISEYHRRRVEQQSPIVLSRQIRPDLLNGGGGNHRRK